MYCRSCGAQLQESARFCTRCGQRLTEPAQTAGMPVQPAAAAPVRRRGGRVWLIVLLAAALVLAAAVNGDDAADISPDSAAVGQSSGWDDSEADTQSGSGQTEQAGALQPGPVADAIDVAAAQAAAAGDLQALIYYAGAEMAFGEFGYSDSTTARRSFDGQAADYQLLSDYVQLLCSRYSFEAVGQPYYETIENTYFEFALRYTGEKAVGCAVPAYNSGSTGDLVISGKIRGDRLDGVCSWDSALTADDDGWRYGLAEPVTVHVGESIGAGLVRLADGSYQTDDGRLTAAVGQAMLLEDGAATVYSARYEIHIPHQRFSVYVEDAYSNVRQWFFIPSTESWPQGLIRTARFIQDGNWAVGSGVEDGLPGYNWTSAFVSCHGGSYVYPVRGMGGEMQALGLRLMAQDGDNLIFYSCAEYRTAPNRIEALIAVSTAVEPWEGDKPDPAQGVTNENGVTEYPCADCGRSGNCPGCGGKGTVKVNGVNEACEACRTHPRKCGRCGGKGWWS